MVSNTRLFSTIIFVEGDDIYSRTKLCNEVAIGIADGRKVVDLYTREEIQSIPMQVKEGTFKDIVVKIVDANKLIPAIRHSSHTNHIIRRLMRTWRILNCSFVFGCNDFSKVDKKIASCYDFIIKAKAGVECLVR